MKKPTPWEYWPGFRCRSGVMPLEQHFARGKPWPVTALKERVRVVNAGEVLTLRRDAYITSLYIRRGGELRLNGYRMHISGELRIYAAKTDPGRRFPGMEFEACD